MKKNILIFHQNLVMGGVEKVTLNIIKNIDKNKFNIKLILVEKFGELLEEIPKDIEVVELLDKDYSIKNNILKYILYLKEIYIIRKKLKKIIKDEDILLNMNMRNIRFNITLFQYKNKKIGWIHGNIMNDFGNFKERINYKLFYQYSIILNVSKEGTDDFNKKFPKLKNRTKTLYNSLDIEFIKKMSVSEKINKNNYLVSVGRLSEEKGFDILIDSIKLLKDDGIDEKLYIIGEGNERDRLEEKIKKLNLEENVFLPGFNSNPYAILKNSKIYILSSRGEGLPTVLIEALACECPIISTDCKCGPREILNNGDYGLLVPVGDAMELKEGIKKMILDNNLRARFKEKSLERAYDFSNKKILKKLENIIERVE